MTTIRAALRTTLDELFKIGPGPSSSHTMGPMRITYHFHRRASGLPAALLARATGFEVHLYGSLSATGRGHGTDRAALAGLLGQSPATCPPELLDGLASDPSCVHALTLGPATLEVGLANILFEDPRVAAPHPNTMSVRLVAGADVLHELDTTPSGAASSNGGGTRRPPEACRRIPTRTWQTCARTSRTGTSRWRACCSTTSCPSRETRGGDLGLRRSGHRADGRHRR